MCVNLQSRFGENPPSEFHKKGKTALIPYTACRGVITDDEPPQKLHLEWGVVFPDEGGIRRQDTTEVAQLVLGRGREAPLQSPVPGEMTLLCWLKNYKYFLLL
jgi:hypothetical protein